MLLWLRMVTQKCTCLYLLSSSFILNIWLYCSYYNCMMVWLSGKYHSFSLSAALNILSTVISITGVGLKEPMPPLLR